MLLCQPVGQTTETTNKTNRFASLFQEADRQFEKEYKLDIEAMKAASRSAVESADAKLKQEREQAIKRWNILDSMLKGLGGY